MYYRQQLVGFIEDSKVDNFRTYGRWRPVASAWTAVFLEAVRAETEPVVELFETGKAAGYVTVLDDGEIEVVTVPAIPEGAPLSPGRHSDGRDHLLDPGEDPVRVM
ncbi:hypothetical protein HS041_29380 [Planomonospora sp. ID67723]|uniref:hypothetical protein n=1 Tax=Planomonospora sp. ID67723 TaxID=2738134 RepID=UPI0018C402B8|nr:hypothetical protein [Planomonospora sp. ID67723]MBG0831833.1 hypothetical protein [Planomonospora sp. ID67723]